MSLPTTGLHAQVETLDGATYRWDRFTRDSANLMLDASKASQLMEGFADATVRLPRLPSVSWPDLDQYATLRLFNDAGACVYEGRIVGTDSDTATGVTSVAAASWMGHARDKPVMPCIYIDRDPGNWTDAPTERVQALKAVGYRCDSARAEPGGAFTFDEGGLPFTAGSLPMSYLSYEAPPGATIAKVLATCQRISADYVSDVSRGAYMYLGVLPDLTGGTDQTSNLSPSISATNVTLTATTATRRWVAIQCWYSAAVGGSDEYERAIRFWNLAVIGPHGLTFDSSNRLRASDIIKHSAALAAPLLDTSGVETTDFTVSQLILTEPTAPYDVWLDVNKLEMKNLAAWENRRVEYADLPTEPKWQVRSDDPRVRIKLDGPTLESQYNGVTVRFQNVTTSRADLVSPLTNSELRNTDPALAANRYGIDAWRTLQLPDPDTPENAARYGAKALAHFNAQRRPGKITVDSHIQDMAGAWHHVSEVRAGDGIIVTDLGDDTMRLINREDYNFATDRVTLTVDGNSQDIDAQLDRVLRDQRRR